jgi:predicted nucleic acid-binding protein
VIERNGEPVAAIISQADDASDWVLAEAMACEFWTAGERLSRAVASELPWVRWLGDRV